MNALQDILDNLDANAPMSWEEIIQMEVSNWERSDEREQMIVGKQYYRNKNDILNYERKTIDADGRMIAAKNLANNKIPHGFIRKLVDQKLGYLLSRPFTAETEKEEYQKLLDGYFDKGFKRMIKNIGKDAINAGKAWLQIYYTENGELAFLRIPPEEVIPFWKDSAHTELSALIRVYEKESYVIKRKEKVKIIQFWTTNGVKIYREEQGTFEFVEERSHFALLDGGEDGSILEANNWERIPFVCFKYNDEEQPLVEMVKKLVDDYDKRTSANSNDLEDLPNSAYVVKNFTGTGAGEFRKNMAEYRVAFVEGDGGIDTIAIEMNNEGYKNHIEQLRRDIYEFGRGVDTQSERFGNSPSGIALRQLYQDLDMDANDIENEFQASLEQLLWFIDQHLIHETKKDYSNDTVEFIFNRDILINETEAVENALKSVGIESMETIVANHPWTTNTKDELARKKKEREGDLLDYPLGGNALPSTGDDDE